MRNGKRKNRENVENGKKREKKKENNCRVGLVFIV
jgi:hypothetical protein